MSVSKSLRVAESCHPPIHPGPPFQASRAFVASCEESCSNTPEYSTSQRFAAMDLTLLDLLSGTSDFFPDISSDTGRAQQQNVRGIPLDLLEVCAVSRVI